MNRWFISMVSDGEYIYWLTELKGHFYKMKIKDLTVEYIKPLGDCITYNGVAILCINKNNIYYVIEGGNGVVIYDMMKNTTKKFDIKCRNMHLNMFSYANVINDTLVIVPMYAPYVINININTGSVSKRLNEGYSMEEMKQYHTNCIKNGDKLEVVNASNNTYLTYSLKDYSKKEYYKIQLSTSNVISIERVYDELYVLDNQNNIYKVDKEGCQKIFKIGNSKDDYLILHRSKDWLWIMPLYGDNIYKYNMTNKNIEIFNEYPADYKYMAPKTMGKFTSKCTVMGKTYFAMHAGTHIFCVDDLTGEAKFLEVKWPEWKEEAEEVIYKKMNTIYEEDLSFEAYLKYGIKYGFDKFLK